MIAAFSRSGHGAEVTASQTDTQNQHVFGYTHGLKRYTNYTSKVIKIQRLCHCLVPKKTTLVARTSTKHQKVEPSNEHVNLTRKRIDAHLKE